MSLSNEIWLGPLSLQYLLGKISFISIHELSPS
jgi:hypothetical protein